MERDEMACAVGPQGADGMLSRDYPAGKAHPMPGGAQGLLPLGDGQNCLDALRRTYTARGNSFRCLDFGSVLHRRSLRFRPEMRLSE